MLLKNCLETVNGNGPSLFLTIFLSKKEEKGSPTIDSLHLEEGF